MGSEDVGVTELVELEVEAREARVGIGELVANAPIPESVAAGIGAGVPVTNFAAAMN